MLNFTQFLSLIGYVVLLGLSLKFFTTDRYRWSVVPLILFSIHGIAFYGSLWALKILGELPSFHDEWSAGLRLHSVITFIAMTWLSLYSRKRREQALETLLKGK
jgi:hypothetical protein